jgi:hypothetical protein
LAWCGLIASGAVSGACGSSERRPSGGPGGGQGGDSADGERTGAGEALAFTAVDGNISNHFYRRGPVAAHLLATSGESPRLLAAFPAGNAGVGLWFAKGARVALAIQGELEPVEREDGMRGVRARVKIAAPQLVATGLVLSSIRVLRDFANDPALVPREIRNQVEGGPPLVVRRTTLDGGQKLELVVEPQAGASTSMDDAGGMVLRAARGARTIDVAFTFLQDDPPLTPIPLEELLRDSAADSERDRRALEFLVYREKMLAGSWRFLTYFGRDTLLSLRLLMPVLKPAAIEGALGSVIDRLDPKGEVAHEEDIGEFAALRHMRAGRPASTQPIYDYKMVDDNYMLAPILAHYLLDTEDGRARAAEFLARRTPAGETYVAAIRRNLEFVERGAKSFAKAPRAANLVELKKGERAGDWRDSDEGIGQGLGGGRYAFSVNVALVPAALDAVARLHASAVLCAAADATCGEDSMRRAAQARSARTVWRKAAGLFEVSLAPAAARSMIKAYGAALGVDAAEALAAVDGPVAFRALSLEKGGRPIPVMHSDESFVLMFLRPDPPVLERIAAQVLRPFPAGLRTPLGMVVANAAFVADKKRRAMFGRDRYHGAVMWSWQQAMMAAGLARQLERTDLPAETRAALTAAERGIWQLIAATNEVRTSENWSWQVKDGRWRIYRLGEYVPDDEGNALQLWSTVYLAVQPPRR